MIYPRGQQQSAFAVNSFDFNLAFCKIARCYIFCDTTFTSNVVQSILCASRRVGKTNISNEKSAVAMAAFSHLAGVSDGKFACQGAVRV